MINLTIAVCTYNRSEFLEICLQHLLPQTKGIESLRILIVDNNSNDTTREVVQNLQTEYKTLEYSLCTIQGLSHARNHALSQCDSVWLSFLDDDAYPVDNWLETNIKLINSGSYDAFGGLYLPWYFVGKKDWFLETYETNSSFMPVVEEKQLAPSDPYFSGGNCTFNVSLLKSVGGFSPLLGMNGNSMGYGEEVAAQRALAIKGARLGFSRNLIIYHYVPMHKQTVTWAWRRAYNIGRDFWFIWDKPVTKKNFRFYITKKVKKSYKQLKVSINNVYETNSDYGMKNLFYDLSTWAGVLGLIIGASERYSRDKKQAVE
ncbi:glycosyltransferase [Paraglaciecola aquimarina]|uniref:Glycosyltransferase n=1 Tax=Paraglaciecola algarum TaxID=3050085 RepID=A0ABS9D6S8_9ALTE|nr:glycosyltransferase [Paraglaciecola sp. G1-23]MCF2948120.1 glycosyltransferase [Paraglaciecola sp. G1-23]